MSKNFEDFVTLLGEDNEMKHKLFENMKQELTTLIGEETSIIDIIPKVSVALSFHSQTISLSILKRYHEWQNDK